MNRREFATLLLASSLYLKVGCFYFSELTLADLEILAEEKGGVWIERYIKKIG